MSRVLVIGALGFCGSHLVDALKAAGHYVVGVDNESQSVQLAAESAADAIFQGDARTLWQFIPKGAQYDYMFHCASPAGPARIAPSYALLPIIEVTKAGLDFAQRIGARFVKFSTSEVYNRADVPLTEETPALVSPRYDARSEYQIGFLAAEQLCFTHPHPAVQVLRLFNVTGPRQSASAGVVLPRFCQQALAGEPLTVFGDGQQRRAFMDVSDLTAFCLVLMEHWPPSAPKRLWNVANPANTVTMSCLAQSVIRMVGKGAIRRASGQEIAQAYRDGAEKVDISIEKALALGWVPQMSLTEIIGRALAWQRETVQA